MDDEDFAYWSENALWMHSQTMMIKQSNAVATAFGAPQKPQEPPRPGGLHRR